MKTFLVSGTVRRYPGNGGWHHILLDSQTSEQIRGIKITRVGWGYVPATVIVGKTSFVTTLFPTKDKVYMLALNAAVRKKEKIGVGTTIQVKINLKK